MYIFGGSDSHYDRESTSSRSSSEYGRLDSGRHVNDMHSFNLGSFTCKRKVASWHDVLTGTFDFVLGCGRNQLVVVDPHHRRSAIPSVRLRQEKAFLMTYTKD
jgi:hypothetical protein